MLTHDALDLRALEERRRDFLREAREDRRAFALEARKPGAGASLGAALCRIAGRKMESAGRALQIMGKRLETRPGRAGELPVGP